MIRNVSETIRRRHAAALNLHPGTRTSLAATYGDVWNTAELSREFTVLGFMAPYVLVSRQRDGVRGSLMFQHEPRFYFGWQEEK